MQSWKLLFLGAAIACQAACQAPAELESTITSPVFALSETSHGFGSVQVGTRSTNYGFTVHPLGVNRQSSQVSALGESCPDFGIASMDPLPFTVFSRCDRYCDPRDCPTPVCEEQTDFEYRFQTFFSPTVAGPSSCVVSIRIDGLDRQITLSGTGTLPPQIVGVQPTSQPFGDVRRSPGNSAPAVITVRSAGSSTLTVSAVTATTGFMITSGPSSVTLASGETQSYLVACQTATLGMLTGQFRVTSNDPTTPVFNVPLSCNVIDSNLDVMPSPAALGTSRVGEPLAMTVNLRNSGTATMTIENVAVIGTGFSLAAGPMAGTVLAAGTGTTTARVGFDAEADGEAEGALVITYDGGQTRTTPVSARALATSMAVTPDGGVDFGPVCIGQTKHQPFTVLANDEGSFMLTRISDSGGGELGAPFAVNAALPAQALGSAANQVGIAIAASPTVVGWATATAVFETDIPGGTPRQINLAVEGLTAGVTATPTSVDLGASPINTASIGQPVHLSNCSSQALAFSNPRIEGRDAADFAIVEQPDTSMIEIAASARWLVVLQPHTRGEKTATFAVDYDGQTVSIPLTGEGLGGSDGGGGSGSGPGDGRASYYACAAGSANALWPIGVLLAMLRWRRGGRRRGAGDGHTSAR